MNKRLLVAILGVTLLSFPLLAQERYDQQLHFKTGVYDCPENLTDFMDAPFRADELRDGQYFRILQFNDIPTTDERKAMSAAGIQLGTYLPKNAYDAAISKDADLSGLSSWGVRSVMNWEPEYKMTTALANKDFPSHALNGKSEVIISVIYRDQVSVDDMIVALQSFDGKVIGRFTQRNQIEVSVPIKELNKIAALPEVYFMEAVDPTPVPENNNERSRRNHRVNFYQNGSTQYGGFDGSGVVVALGDDGAIGPHIDYAGRLDQRYVGPSSGGHGDHCAGIIFSAGNQNPDGRGNAPGAFLFTYEPFDNVDSAFIHYNKHQVRITSTSYGNGCNAGYTSYASYADQTIYDNPSLMHVFSAGNSGGSNCGYGAGSGWGNITGGIKVGKNTLAVGNVQFNDNLASSSSRGPAEDGRIKPDVCAVGTSVYSTQENNNYTNLTGTSMACPGVAGTLATMYQAYKETNAGAEPHSALMKGILMNTAEDLGNQGPDFRFGFGRVNARRAQEAIVNQTYFVDSMTQGGSDTYNLTVPAGIGELKIMLYWNDVEGAPFAFTPLVNDLQLQVTDPTSTVFDPWVLDHTPSAAALSANATRGVDNMNNVEQVTIDNPAAGSYTLTVSGPQVPSGPQHYVLVYQYTVDDEIVVTHPNGGDVISVGSNSPEYIRWDALSNGTGFTIDYSDDNGATWSTIGTAGANARIFAWNVPSSLGSDQVLVRVSRGSASDESDSTNTALSRVSGFQVQSVCPDSLVFTWNSVSGASSYEIMKLDTAYMQVVATSTTTTGIVLSHDPSKDNYYTIRAVGANGGKGERRNAVHVPAGVQNCTLSDDLSVRLLSPFNGPFPGCVDTSSTQLIVEATNTGLSDLHGLTFTYQVNGGPLVTESWTDTLPAGSVREYVFTSNPTVNATSPNDIVLYSDLSNDQNRYNDTAKATFYYLSSAVSSSAPWMDNLESFSPCATTTNCGATVCALNGGWINLVNGVDDGIDWRTNFGSTGSSNTGPSQDFNPGTSNGKYLYLEASFCFVQEAILYSPCIDLNSNTSYELTYRYHMDGATMGTLHTDVIANGRLYEDVIPPVSGDQGSLWNEAYVNMTPFAGSTVTIRLRGETGPDFESDIALDDFELSSPTVAPVADFDASNFIGCPGTQIDFTNTSSGAPYSYNWYVSPATGWSYANGTSSTTQDLSLIFNTTGTFTVGLLVDNGAGTDSVGISQSVVIGGTPLPFYEDFEASSSMDQFVIENPDNNITWERLPVGGLVGSWAVGMRNRDYLSANSVEREDFLFTPILDFSGSTNPHLTFDHAYVNFNAGFYDSLYIDVSTDCGETWTRIASYDGIPGGNLETAPSQTTFFTPSTPGEWCIQGATCTDVDLTSYSGFAEVLVRFLGKSGLGNNLYIDNIHIGPPLQQASISTDVSDACTGDVVNVSDISAGSFTNYSWDFGTDATPPTATGPGPHTVVYSTDGTKTIALVADNGGAPSNAVTSVQVAAPTSAQFNVSNPAVGSATFTPQANQSDIDSLMWDFGDGNTSDQYSPTHAYTANGTYTAGLTVYSECGLEYVSLNVTIQGIGLEEMKAEDFRLYPQPTSESINLTYEGQLDGEVTIKFTDAQGRTVLEQLVSGSELMNGLKWNVKNWAAGTYFLMITTETQYWRTPIIKN